MDCYSEERSCVTCRSVVHFTMVDKVACEAIAAVPHGWIVFDRYPPGDDGLGFACSVKCLRKFQDLAP